MLSAVCFHHSWDWNDVSMCATLNGPWSPPHFSLPIDPIAHLTSRRQVWGIGVINNKDSILFLAERPLREECQNTNKCWGQYWSLHNDWHSWKPLQEASCLGVPNCKFHPITCLQGSLYRVQGCLFIFVETMCSVINLYIIQQQYLLLYFLHTLVHNICCHTRTVFRHVRDAGRSQQRYSIRYRWYLSELLCYQLHTLPTELLWP